MFSTVLITPSYRCNPEAKTEIHTITAHHHFCMYITAMKSLLRYCDDLAVVVHDDGTLTPSDKNHLRTHINGIRIIDRKTADKKMNKLLSPFPCSKRFRNSIVNSMELFDNILLAETGKIISMNSDVLFFRKPVDVIDWLYNDATSIKSVYERNPANQKNFLQKFNCPFPPHFTLCLVCFFKETFDMHYVENILAESKHDWFTAQNIYPLFFHKAADKYPTVFLDENRYQSSGIFDQEVIFRHYWTSTGMFTDLQIEDSGKMIRTLSEKKRD